MIITFNTETTKINVTTIGNIEEYRYFIKEFLFKNIIPEENFIIINGIKIDLSPLNVTNNCVQEPYPEGDDVVTVDKKNIKNTDFYED